MRTWLLRTFGLLAAIAAGLEIYTRLPTSAATSPLNLPADTRYVVLLIHGVRGENEPLLLEVAERIQAAIGSQPGTAVRHYDWSPWSDSRLRSRKHALAMAPALGTELAALPQLQHIRLIVHSAGGYWPTPLCRTYKDLADIPAHVETTYLDPMGIHGAWDYTYGYRNYGTCEDFALGIFNSDEPIPGTNAPLAPAYSIDVTASPERTDINGHLWPIQYFLNHLDATEMLPGERSHQRMPRGTVRVE